MHKKLLCMSLAGVLALLAACGGGSSSNSSDSATEAQKSAVRAHLDDVYLWYNEIASLPASSYGSAPAYFQALLVRSKDRFSYSAPLTEVGQWQEGLETGFGVRWGFDAQDRLCVYYVDPNSPAASSLSRGDVVLSVNGQQVATSSIDYLSQTLFPDQPGKSVTLTVSSADPNWVYYKTITSATFSTTMVAPPQILALPGGAKAGYLLFNRHLRNAEQGLAQATSYFKEQGVGDLVLDMRYNGGGYLTVAEDLASMIGGAAVQGKVFERVIFNARHPERTQDPNNTLRFDNLDSKGAVIPMLGLSRLIVLTGPSTCSASESVINGLSPYVQVVTIGTTTCGKPYGSIQQDIGDHAYFAIEFEAVNANGASDYKSGFAPTCRVPDDLSHTLGDSQEAILKAALYYAANNSCPPIGPYKAAPSQPEAARDVQMLGEKPGLKLL